MPVQLSIALLSAIQYFAWEPMQFGRTGNVLASFVLAATRFKRGASGCERGPKMVDFEGLFRGSRTTRNPRFPACSSTPACLTQGLARG